MPNDPATTAPAPPPGYSLLDLPAFEQAANVGTHLVSAPPMQVGQGQVVADVDHANPQTIQVRYPAGYTKAVNTHEATHVYQQSRNASFSNPEGQQQATTAKDYDYGGVSGLIQAQQQGKTISSFSPEQQAQLVADYQQQTQQAIQKGDRTALARVTAAYHPFVSQLAAIPAQGANMTQMTQQNLTPAAPMVPPATVAGMPMQPDPLLGGQVRPPAGYRAVPRLLQ